MQEQLHLTVDLAGDDQAAEYSRSAEEFASDTEIPDCWRLDDRTRTVGMTGVARARQALDNARIHRFLPGADAA